MAGLPSIESASRSSCQNPVGRFREVVNDDDSVQFSHDLLLHLRPIARPHEDALPDASVPAALQVDQLVADHIALCEVEAELVAGIEEKLRAGLATAAWLLRRFGREVDLF